MRKVGLRVITITLLLVMAYVSNPVIEAAKPKTVTLKFWHLWTTPAETNKVAIDQVLANFKKAYPHIKVEVDAVENETYKTKIKTAIAANEAPDVFFTWGGGFSKPFVDAGKLLDLTPYLKDGTSKKLVGGTLTYQTYNGKVYALPFALWAGIMYCNQSLFEKYNVKIPGTFKELLAAVSVFRSKGITPLEVGEKDRWPGMFYQNILAVRTAGTKLSNNALAKKASFNQRAFIQSAELLKQLVKAGAFESGCLGITRDESEANFRLGKAAMYYNGSWVAGSLNQQQAPDVYGKIVARNFPVVEGSNGEPNGFLGGAVDAFAVNAGTKHPKEAVLFVKYVAEQQAKIGYQIGALLPAWKVQVDESKLPELTVQISKLIKGATGFVLAWDTFLEGADADTHKNLVQEIFADMITPQKFAIEMQKLNSKK
ncbi:MAG TPA: extracellular solute-binding protein [Bacillota bacterium]|nr:extracellular solute-binding protein [Bacillota bacterium]